MDTCNHSGLRPLAEALENQLNQIYPISRVEQVVLSKAHGRVLAEPIVAQIDVPSCDNSAMDGYAIKLQSTVLEKQYKLIGKSLAGHPYSGVIDAGETVRIMTGAAMPEGANCVIMQENSTIEGDNVSFSGDVKTGQNIRRKGSDIPIGSKLIDAGVRLSAPHIAMLASLGINLIKVYQQPVVGIVSTGDELVSPGQPLSEGDIYESNRFGLQVMLSRLPVRVIDYGILPDDPDTISEVFNQAAKQCDWLLSSGGVSVGDADYVKDVMNDIGNIDFWKVAIKPGKPYAFGQIKSCWFSGLPGNPVSSFVTFLQLVVPCLRKLSGEKDSHEPTLQAILEKDIKQRPGRQDFQRGIYQQAADGSLQASPLDKQSSGVMTSFLKANCFIVVPADADYLPKGTPITILPFGYLLQ